MSETATWGTRNTEQVVIVAQENGVEVTDVTGATVEFVLFDQGNELAMTKTTPDFTVEAPTFTYNLTTMDLDGLPSGVYDYEWRLTDSTGDHSKGDDGQVTIVGLRI